MSVIIPRDKLSQEESLKIRKLLHIKPKADFKGRQGKGTYFYYVGDNYVLLPYYFGTVLTDKIIWPDVNLYEFKFTGKLYQNQVSVSKEAHDQLSKYGTTLLKLRPGFGKTVIGAYLASKLQCRTLVTFTLVSLIRQWSKTFYDFTNAKVWIVGKPNKEQKDLINDRTYFCNEMPKSFDVILCMEGRISSVPKDVLSSVGTLIIDEAHLFCTHGRGQTLLQVQPRYVIAETATPSRDNQMDRMLYQIVGTHGVFKANDVPFDVYKLSLPSPNVIYGTDGVNWTETVRLLSENERRNETIFTLVELFSDRKILILTERVEHATYLSNELSKKKNIVLNLEDTRSDYIAGKKSTYKDCRVLVGTKKIGVGFDEATFCPDYKGKRLDMLILVISMKSLSKLEQAVGRVLRAENPIIIDLVDDHRKFHEHWNRREKWFISNGGTIQELTLE